MLITGATGTIGREVVEQLVARGARPRVLTRDAKRVARNDVDVAIGDFGDAGSLGAALAGVDRVFLLDVPSPVMVAHATTFLETARTAGVRKVVKLSSIGVDVEPPVLVAGWHAAVEEAVRASGLAWTMLRPAGFASNTLSWAQAIRAGKPIPLLGGHGGQGIVDPRDIAALAVLALETDRFESRALTLTGPEVLSARAQIATLERVLGRAITVSDMTLADLRAQLERAGVPADLIPAYLEGSSYLDAGKAAFVSDELSVALGRPARSFETWARDRRAAFE